LENFIGLEDVFLFDFMAILNTPMPSFTLVLTSGHFDTLPSAPDRLMTTSINQEDVDSPVILNEAELLSSGSIAKEGRSIKANMLLFLRKFGKLALLKKIFSST